VPSVVRRSAERRDLLADHPQGVWEDLAILLRAKARDAHDASSRYLRNSASDASVHLFFWFPTLVLDAPLYTYDVQTGELASVERLTLNVSVDTFNGVFDDYVDIVTVAGLDSLVTDYNEAAEDIARRMTNHVETVLLAVARNQAENLRNADLAAEGS